MTSEYQTLYKIDSKGKTRVWWIEQSNEKYRTWDGIQSGKIKCSEWRITEPTNVGRANYRDGVAQAVFEIEALYKKKTERDYHLTIEDANNNGSHIFEPMLAETYKSFAVGYVQPKLDGIRCIINKDGMWSRAGKPIISCPHIITELEHIFEAQPSLILDGELYNHNLKDDFNEIQSLVMAKSESSLTEEHFELTRMLVEYNVYDIPSLPALFSYRKDALDELFKNRFLRLRLVKTEKVLDKFDYQCLHEDFLEEGYEGSIWRADTLYENKRTKNLLKRKEFMDEEFELFSIEEGKGNWAGAAKAVLFRVPGAVINPGDQFVENDKLYTYKDGVVPGPNAVRATRAGIKGNKTRAKQLLGETHKIVTIKYFNLTPDGVPRFGVAIKFHGEKREY